MGGIYAYALKFEEKSVVKHCLSVCVGGGGVGGGGSGEGDYTISSVFQ